MAEVKLPSGAILRIQISDFAIAQNLFQAVMEEGRHIPVDSKTDLAAFFKNIVCVGFSSRKVDACVWECFKRCTYSSDGSEMKVSKDTFESVQAREDYVPAYIAVLKENTLPFAKSLYAAYGQFLEMTGNSPP